jgi:hypothetical protein
MLKGSWVRSVEFCGLSRESCGEIAIAAKTAQIYVGTQIKQKTLLNEDGLNTTRARTVRCTNDRRGCDVPLFLAVSASSRPGEAGETLFHVGAIQGTKRPHTVYASPHEWLFTSPLFKNERSFQLAQDTVRHLLSCYTSKNDD